MNAKVNFSPMLRQRGATLVEMMVAITIGLVVTLIVTQAYLSGRTTQSSQSGLTRMHESGRFGTLVLSNEIMKAGFRDVKSPYPGKTFGSGGTLVPHQHQLQGTDGGPSKPGDAVFAGDTLTVRFFGENSPASVTNVADGHTLDCFGNAITSDTLVTESLYIAADPDNGGEPALFCMATYKAGTAGAPGCAAGNTCSKTAALIPGVESMQLLYGLDVTGAGGYPDGMVDYYVNAALVADANWKNVLSVKISLVVRSPAGSDNPTEAQATWNHFGSVYAPDDTAPDADPGSVYTSPVDHRYRQVFSTVVQLRQYEN